MVIKRQNTPADSLMAGEYLFAMREFALVRGICAKALLHQTDIDMNTLLSPPRHLSAKDVRQVGTNFVMSLSNPIVASIEFGQSMFLGIHGALGVAAQGAGSLLEASQLINKFASIRSGINNIEFSLKNEYSEIFLKEIPLNNEPREEFVQFFFNLATLVSIAMIIKQFLSGHELEGKMILNIAQEEPENFPYDLLKDVEVNFSISESGLLLPLTWISLPITKLNQELVEAATIQCENDLQLLATGGITDEIEKILLVSKSTPPTVEELAAHFCMSVSSLQRRLREKDTTYTKIRSNVLCKKASKLLLETDYTIEDIASYVGFSDASNFSKSFKQWSGMTPRAYRDK